MWSSTLFFRAGLALLSFSLTIQSTTAAADTWSIDTNCNKNGTNGGIFTDSLGAVWEVKCAQDLSEPSYQDQGVSDQGIYACFKACDNKPQCTGFVYRGSDTNPVPSQWLLYSPSVTITSLTCLQPLGPARADAILDRLQAITSQ
jgi:hypothetical protein